MGSFSGNTPLPLKGPSPQHPNPSQRLQRHDPQQLDALGWPSGLGLVCTFSLTFPGNRTSAAFVESGSRIVSQVRLHSSKRCATLHLRSASRRNPGSQRSLIIPCRAGTSASPNPCHTDFDRKSRPMCLNLACGDRRQIRHVQGKVLMRILVDGYWWHEERLRGSILHT